MEKRCRLFVAVELPHSIRSLLTKKQKGLSGMRWTALENLHLTLRFIGDTSETALPVIREGLKTIHAESFLLRLRGLGFFYRKERAVFWAGLENSQGLIELKQQVDKALEIHAGLEADPSNFSPHITLGRMKQADKRVLQAFIKEKNVNLDAEFRVKSFSLFSSVLTPGGALYRVEESYPLGLI